MKKILFLIILLLTIQNSSATEVNIDQIEADFISADILINRMKDEGFFVQRLEDTLKAATQIFEAQSKIPESIRDYSIVEQYLEEIFNLESEAYIAKDEVDYVKKTYDNIKENNPNIDLSGADQIFEEMIFEFESERYDRAYDIAKDTYKKLIEIEGQYTALNLAYQATTKSIKNFILNNWLILSILISSTIALYIIFRNRFIYFRIKLKIKNLEKESKVLEELIKTSQLGYFEKGTIPESTYRIRIKKFSELIRDINRQLPLLREELMKRRKSELNEAKKEVKKHKLKKENIQKQKKVKKRKNSKK